MSSRPEPGSPSQRSLGPTRGQATVGDRRSGDLVRVFEEDPELLRNLDAETAATARRHVVTEVVSLRPGGAVPRFSRASEDGPRLGLLVLEGLWIRRLGIGEGVTAELFGAGDVLWPSEESDDFSSTQSRESWKVCAACRLAVLDRSFWTAAARWPEVAAELGARTARRADSLAHLRAIARVQRLDARLYAVLSHLADRWGRVERGGTGLPLKLSQQTLADLAGARRQSVNLALRQLQAEEAIERRPRGGWLLKRRSPAERPPSPARAPGPTLP